MIELVYHEERCMGCGNCTTACPVNLGVMRVENGKLKPDNRCQGCGICVSACPFSALELKLPSLKSYEKIMPLSQEHKKTEVRIRKTRKQRKKVYSDYLSEWFSTGLLRRIFEADGFDFSLSDMIKKFERGKSSFALLEELVIARKLCSLCGACISACPEDAVQMNGFPELVGECKNCGSCLLKCPKTSFFHIESHGDIGTYKHIFAAKSIKINVVKAGSGAATSLLIHAMEEEKIDCAIVVGKKPFIATKPHQLVKGAGMKSAVAPTLSLVKNAVKTGFKKIAVVGVPCQVTAARKMQKLGCDEIKLILGIFCPRGNHPEKDAISCKTCTDLTAEHADISFGNTGSPVGWRTIIVRTGIGEDIVNGAISKGYIQTGRCDVEKVVKMAKRKRARQ